MVSKRFKLFVSSVARALISACGLAVIAASCHAEPSVPWAPSAAGRHHLALLVDEAGLEVTLTQWPLPRAAVVRALDALPAALSPAHDAARAALRRELDEQQTSRLAITLRGRDEALTGFGDDATPGSAITLRSAAVGGDLVAAQLGGRIEANGSIQGGRKVRLDDSALVTEAFGAQLQAWSHRSWWGPGWQSSLALGNNAPAFSGVGVQRALASRSDSPWLAWLGPWSAEMFIAQAEDVTQPANPYFVAQRLTMRPLPNLEIGFTRTAQWGGRGRAQSLRSFFEMLAGTGVNADTRDQQRADPANELGGYDLRLRCPGGAPCAAYVQLMGEDRAGLFPSHFLGLYGIESWSADGRQRYFAELAETGCEAPVGRPMRTPCAYRNYAYPEGYTSGGRWIGANVGPDSRLLTLGWLDAAGGSSLRFNVGRVGARVGSFTPRLADATSSGRLVGISARQRLQWGGLGITPEFDWLRISARAGHRTEARIGATLQMSLDDVYAGASGWLGTSLSGANPSALQPVWVAAGLVAGAALFDVRADDYARAHNANRSARAFSRLGSAIPLAGAGLAGLSWIAQRGSVQGDVAEAALTAGASALLLSEVGKFATGRARPIDALGAASFGEVQRTHSSFPSAHSALAWAVLTPYAKHHDAPWLYALAALTGAGRVMQRSHWVSDTVAGAALGYYLGDTFYRGSGAANDAGRPRLWITPRSVTWQMTFE
jgi:membrane-associated phospholipid phosphatase